jgi:tetratricopeptide (TPR) repeat protein
MPEDVSTRRKQLLEIISREGEYSRPGLMARNDLAETYTDEGLLGDALVMQEKTLEMQHGSNDVDLRLATLSRLSLLYDAQNQFGRAEKTLKEELELRTAKFGKQSPDTLVTSCHLARVYKRLRNFKDAARLLKEVIDIQGKVCYVGHLDTKISKDLYESLPREFRE